MINSSHGFNTRFLGTMLKGLKLAGASYEKMSCHERKKAIELSANLAMAAASSGRSWSHALIARHARKEKSRVLVWRILGRRRHEKFRRMASWLRRRGKGRDSINGGASRVTALSLAEKNRRVLQKLVPGGVRCTDEFSLMGEAIDYAISLQAQVNQMRLLAEAIGVPIIR